MRHYTFEGSFKEILEAFERLASLEETHSAPGLLQGFNPLLKIATFGSFILSALAVDTFFPLLFMAISLICLVALARVDVVKFICRSIFIPVFALIISLPILFTAGGTEILRIGGPTSSITISNLGLSKILVFTSRVWVCVATVVLLTSTTDFMMLTRVLRKVKIPRFFISITFMTYRYIFLTLHEVYSLLLAKESRTFSRKRTLSMGTLRFLGNVFASLLVRAYERSERVYLAMVARGYDSFDDGATDIALSYSSADAVLTILIVSLDITTLILNSMRFGWV